MTRCKLLGPALAMIGTLGATTALWAQESDDLSPNVGHGFASCIEIEGDGAPRTLEVFSFAGTTGAVYFRRDSERVLVLADLEVRDAGARVVIRPREAIYPEITIAQGSNEIDVAEVRFRCEASW